MGDGGDERMRDRAAFKAWCAKVDEHSRAKALARTGQLKMSPYRSLPVVRSSVMVEAARCSWCRFYEGVDCEHPCYAGEKHRARAEVNPRGECSHWSPSWWTRVLRCLGFGRARIMVDPKAWRG